MQTHGEFRRAVDIYIYIYQTLGHYISSDVFFVITFQIAASERTKPSCLGIEIFLSAAVVADTVI